MEGGDGGEERTAGWVGEAADREDLEGEWGDVSTESSLFLDGFGPGVYSYALACVRWGVGCGWSR